MIIRKTYTSLFNISQLKGVIKSMCVLDSSVLAVLTTKTNGNERFTRLSKMNGQKKIIIIKALDAHKVDKLYERAIKKIHIIKKIY